jgi:hypothetical protein
MKKLYTVFLVLALAVVMIMPVGLANADSDSTIKVNGGVVVTTEEWTIEGFSGSCMIGRMKHTLSFDGSLKGEAVEELSYYMRSYNGELTFIGEGIQEFAGTLLDGEEGTYTATVSHKGWEVKSPPKERFEQTIVSSAGGLANLSGTIAFDIQHTGDGVWEGTYSGEVAPKQLPFVPNIYLTP